MKFKQNIKIERGLAPIILVPFIDVIFLLSVFFIFASSYVVQAGIKVKFPKVVTSEAIKEDNLIITMTGENVLYLNNTVTTTRELKHELSQPIYKDRVILIKADRRASLGRIIDIWDICRDAGIEKVNIATDQEQ